MGKKRKNTQNNMKKLHKDTFQHLAEDIKGYKKERKYLKKEIQEDKELQKKFKGVKNGSSKSYSSAKSKRAKNR